MKGKDTSIKTTSEQRRNIKIPERIIKKLSRVAGLEYEDQHAYGGGGLCLGIRDTWGVRPRRVAMRILGNLVSCVGGGSSNRAVEGTGACWLDVLGWREDVEYAQLWQAAIRVKREIAAAMLEDELWERGLRGVDIEESKNIGGVLQAVTVHKVDNGLGVQLLKGLGFVGKEAAGKRKVLPAVPGVDRAGDNGKGEEEEGVRDTVFFKTRREALVGMTEKEEG